jgi:hypothetical protein
MAPCDEEIAVIEGSVWVVGGMVLVAAVLALLLWRSSRRTTTGVASSTPQQLYFSASRDHRDRNGDAEWDQGSRSSGLADNSAGSDSDSCSSSSSD